MSSPNNSSKYHIFPPPHSTAQSIGYYPQSWAHWYRHWRVFYLVRAGCQAYTKSINYRVLQLMALSCSNPRYWDRNHLDTWEYPTLLPDSQHSAAAAANHKKIPMICIRIQWGYSRTHSMCSYWYLRTASSWSFASNWYRAKPWGLDWHQGDSI